MSIHARRGLVMLLILEKKRKKYITHCEFDQLEEDSMTLMLGKNGQWQNQKLEMLAQPHYDGFGTLF